MSVQVIEFTPEMCKLVVNVIENHRFPFKSYDILKKTGVS